MKNEITVVSAFFNINRASWDKFERTADQYFDYFTGWAKLLNNIVVYVDSNSLKDKIMEFRKSIGLLDKTIVHVIGDFRNIDAELYDSIKSACGNKTQHNWRMYSKNPEVWNADYDYVMLLKMWCAQDAVRRGETSNMTAWVDFGYNHGGSVISKDSDFSYMWEYPFEPKMNVFTVQPLDQRPIFDIVCTMDTYIMGTVIVGASELWEPFWKLMKNQMIELNHVGLVDDDQNIILMCYRHSPEMFHVLESGWQLPLKQYGGNHLKCVPLPKKNMVKDIYHFIQRKSKVRKYIQRIKKQVSSYTVH